MAKHQEKTFAEKVKKMTGEELGIELNALRERMYTLRSQSVTEKVEDVSQFGITKRNIARILTEQNARGRAGTGEPSAPRAPRSPAAAGKRAKAPAKPAPKAPPKATAAKTPRKAGASARSAKSARTAKASK
ncbi:MAG TPA: 50S ribosomal protein L29 [Phycisphaerales bacterium]|nr:50S ribosomal protein L29 [Phycisphaerales bacterium]